jgi:mannose-6-phosphate isomerase
MSVPVIEPRELSDRVWVYDSPAPEFRLYRAELGQAETALPGDGARILLCTDGIAKLRAAAAGALKVGRGESCFLSAADGLVSASGPAVAFVAASGLSG